MQYRLSRSTRSNKKYMVKTPDGKTVHFGGVRDSGVPYDDYTVHKDPERKSRYVARHKTNENWRKSGTGTAGFWSRWLLWNKPTLSESVSDTERRFGLDIVRSR